MSNGEIIISVVTAVLVVFSLVVSTVIPKGDPNFPGRRNLVTFTLVCLVLVGGTLAAVEVYGAEDHVAEAAEVAGEDEPAGEPPAGESGGAEPEPGEAESPPPDEEAGEAPPPAGSGGDPVAGSEIYASAGCGSCHVLADAGSTGAIGPNLDESPPSFELVVDRVTNGAGAMPSFSGQLSAAEIDDVAAYVVAATSG